MLQSLRLNVSVSRGDAKVSRKSLLIVIVIFLVSSILMGCSTEKYPIHTVAVIDDKVIMEEQIKNEIVERNIAIKIWDMFICYRFLSSRPRRAWYG